MINIMKINSDTLVEKQSDIHHSLNLKLDSNTVKMDKIANWVIENVPWVDSATGEKLEFMQNSPMIFGADDAFTTSQGLIGRQADCVGQSNTFAFLCEGLDVAVGGYVTTNNSSHRVAIVDANSDNPKVFDISLCQSYLKTHSVLPDSVKFMDMSEYIDRAPIDVEKSISRYGMSSSALASSKLDSKTMLLALSDIHASSLSHSLENLSNLQNAQI